jgi:acyl dehydratase
MPIDLGRALGASLRTTTSHWDEDRLILYHLGVGAGNPPTSPSELAYCYEGDLKALPSFGAIPSFPSLINVGAVEGMDFNLAGLLHAQHDLVLNEPIPLTGSVVNHGRVVEIFDTGRAANVIVEVVSCDSTDGRDLFTNRAVLYLRGEGGFGGEPGPAPGNEPPDRPPDLVVESPTLPQQALLYRLSGDKNPLHADPAFATLAGFDRPILHGLCSYGIVCRAVVEHALSGEVDAVKRYQVRFSGVVFPGETILTSMWQEADRVVLASTTKERGKPVISNAAIWVGK